MESIRNQKKDYEVNEENIKRAFSYFDNVKREDVFNSSGKYYIHYVKFIDTKYGPIYKITNIQQIIERDFGQTPTNLELKDLLNLIQLNNCNEIEKKLHKFESYRVTYRQLMGRLNELFYLKEIYKILYKNKKIKSQGSKLDLVQVCFDNHNHFFFDMFIPSLNLLVDCKSKGVEFGLFQDVVNNRKIENIYQNSISHKDFNKIQNISQKSKELGYNFCLLSSFISKQDVPRIKYKKVKCYTYSVNHNTLGCFIFPNGFIIGSQFEDKNWSLAENFYSRVPNKMSGTTKEFLELIKRGTNEKN